MYDLKVNRFAVNSFLNALELISFHTILLLFLHKWFKLLLTLIILFSMIHLIADKEVVKSVIILH